MITKKNKKALVWREVALWIIALMVLAVIILGIFMLKDKGFSLIDRIKEIIRFR